MSNIKQFLLSIRLVFFEKVLKSKWNFKFETNENGV